MAEPFLLSCIGGWTVVRYREEHGGINLRSICLTGAAGHIGRMLVPRLLNMDCPVTLIGDNSDELCRVFPSVPNMTFSDFYSRHNNFDILVHLAGANGTAKSVTEPSLIRDIEQTLSVARHAQECGVRTLMYPATVNQLLTHRESDYVSHKNKVLTSLALTPHPPLTVLYLGAVYGADNPPYRLRALKWLPKPVVRMALQALLALRQSTNVDLLARAITDVPSSTLHTSSIILTDDNRKLLTYKLWSIFLDVAVSILLGAILLFLFPALFVLVKSDSPGQFLLRQERVGEYLEKFRCLKIRTMFEGAPQVGSHELQPSTITRVGHFLRKSKLDEFPQVMNILSGEMAVIGPRPSLVNQINVVSQRAKYGVFRLRPGVTGLAQVSGIDMSRPPVLASFDSLYAQLRCVELDIRILLATLRKSGPLISYIPENLEERRA